MLKNRMNFYAKILSLVFFVAACSKKIDAPPIGNNISYPGSLIALDSNHFLMLNTSANGDYSDGSIQQYLVDTSGNYSLQNVISVPTHGTEIAVSPDSKLVALSFDNSFSTTQIQFYNYSNPSSPTQLSNITLNLFSAGGKQSVKRLHFFTPIGGGNYYYFYGSIYSYPQDDGSNSSIPYRVFVAKVAKDFSSSNVMFTLSYGIGDPNSLAPKSNSIVTYPYSFGSSAPTFDEKHNLLIAFPTGSVGGLLDSKITYPPNPNTYYYFSGQTNANVSNCGSVAVCSQPDMRVNSLFAVDFTAILSGDPLNNSVYFAPLAWNANGVPYGGTTNNVILNYANYNSVNGSTNSDLTSLSFQTNFWSSYWVNAPNLGNPISAQQCYTSNSTTAINEYNLNLLGENALLVGKIGLNGSGDLGIGNEVFQIAGLDILKNSITTIKTSRVNVNINGETDFNTIALVQILDPFNTYYSTLKSTWLNSAASPIVPYMYSRTTGVSSFDATPSAAINFSTFNFGSNSCLPYWVRDTNVGFGNVGVDSAWLSANAVSIIAGTNSTFYHATVDPVLPYNFAFPYADGAQVCTDVSPVLNTPKVFCANFLRGTITRFNAAPSGTIFTKY